jgi:hypothetical protein
MRNIASGGQLANIGGINRPIPISVGPRFGRKRKSCKSRKSRKSRKRKSRKSRKTHKSRKTRKSLRKY